MDLKDLQGKKMFSGIDRETVQISGEDCEKCTFILDGVAYCGCEDPNDGYRSTMSDLEIVDVVVKNTFSPVEVMVVHQSGGRNDTDDILELRRASDGALILEIGTSNIDDCYPSFVCNFSPENIGSV